MSYCVIAIKENFHFRSVFCRCREDLELSLQKFHGSFSAAKRLIGQGDISLLNKSEVRSYARDWGFSWSYARPAEFCNRQALLDYARAAQVNSLHIFESDGWKTEKIDNNVAMSFVA